MATISVGTAEDRAAYVRKRRDKLLRESDWTQLPDSPADTAAWATYRQALRDFPEAVVATASSGEIVWPEPPE